MGTLRAWYLWVVVALILALTRAKQGAEHPQDHDLHHRPAVYRHARARRVSTPEDREDSVVGLLMQHPNVTSKSSNTSVTMETRLSENRPKISDEIQTSVNSANVSSSSEKERRRSHPTETCEAGTPLTKQRDASDDDKVIDVAVIVPCNASHQYSRVKVLPVVELAVRHLRETGLRGPLQNYTINVRYRDSRTSSTYGPLAAVDLYLNNSAGKRVFPQVKLVFPRFILLPSCLYLCSHVGGS